MEPRLYHTRGETESNSDSIDWAQTIQLNVLLCRTQIAAMPEAKHVEVLANWRCSNTNAVFCTCLMRSPKSYT